MGGFLVKTDDTPVLVYAHHAEPGGFPNWNANACDSHVGGFLHVPGEQFAVVHFIHVIPAKDEHMVGIINSKYVDILIHGISGALVPGFLDTLLGRQQFHKFLETSIKKTPSMLDMAD
jgi:hypothetical protein